MRTFLKPSIDAEKVADSEYTTQIAVARDSRGVMVDFLKILMKKHVNFSKKKRGKIFSRDFFEFFWVSTCSRG